MARQVGIDAKTGRECSEEGLLRVGIWLDRQARRRIKLKRLALVLSLIHI